MTPPLVLMGARGAVWSLLLVRSLARELLPRAGEPEPSWVAGLIWLPVFAGLVAMGLRSR